MGLVEDAYDNLRKREEEQRFQMVADRLCADLRVDCEKILGSRGIREFNGIPLDTDHFPLSAALDRLMIAAIVFIPMRFKGLSPYVLTDQLSLTREVNEDSPIKVSLLSAYAVPEKSPFIRVGVNGLGQFLSLRKTHGEIYVPTLYRRSPLPALSFERRANLEDAEKYQSLMRQVFPHYF